MFMFASIMLFWLGAFLGVKARQKGDCHFGGLPIVTPKHLIDESGPNLDHPLPDIDHFKRFHFEMRRITRRPEHKEVLGLVQKGNRMGFSKQ